MATSRNEVIEYLSNYVFLGSFGFLVVVQLFTHFLSGRCVKLSVQDRRIANWFLCNGVFFNLFLDVFAGQFHLMGIMSEQYVTLDPRYKFGLHHDGGQAVFMTSLVELLVQSPLCILTYWGYHHNASWRRVTELLASMWHLGGIWWMYLPEALRGFPYVEADKNFEFSFRFLMYYWFGYWFCGILWTIIPLWITWKTGKEISDAIEMVKSK